MGLSHEKTSWEFHRKPVFVLLIGTWSSVTPSSKSDKRGAFCLDSIVSN